MKQLFTIAALVLFSFTSYAQVTESKSIAFEAPETLYKFSATVSGSKGSHFFLINNPDGLTDVDYRDKTNMGPNLFFTADAWGNASLESFIGHNNFLYGKLVKSSPYAVDDINQKFDIEFIIDPVNYTYTLKVKKNSESVDAFYTLLEDQPFFFFEQSDGSYLFNQFKLTHYQPDDITVENIVVEEMGSLAIDNNSLISGVYPNPTVDFINLETIEAIESIEIFDISGSLIRTVDAKDSMKYRLNVSNLETGVYILRIKTQETIATSRIIKK